MDDDRRDRRAIASSLALDELPPDAPAAQAALDAYVRELDDRFPDHFVPGPMSAADVAELTRPRGAFVVAVHQGEPVACGGVRRLDPGTVEVKRMWVHRDWRGAGLGGRLLRHLEATAVDLGCRRIVLDTHRVLAEAVALYGRAGYREIERYNDNPYAEAWFEKRVAADPGAGPTLSR
ncbi:GNAT family N-acetyltransferase [Nocardioides sp. HDW12B]|uniref:GNAT family N-acetyltransferase n=1 Tax=Nocardioides sp. HDW12B TaxID=2714939 RepID=UPI001409EEE8|nr:GNAT family N-acetyltransferase [Nocardioides sp. HDW12B]QIK65488.1 GNAT family N-acetyltransferase [Nocardioides sp. HDW12B]